MSTPAPVEGLAVSGLTELALVGWPMSLAVSRPDDLAKIAIRSARPELKDHSAYRAGVIGSFIATTWGFTGLAGVAWRRWCAAR
jgi:hypothetical protein